MIQYLSCADTSMDAIYEAFCSGYSDYILPVHIERDAFESIFFGREGNSPDLSFVALDDNRPVGLVLGGIRDFDGMKTLRCGALCTAPTHRGVGVGGRLSDMHRQLAEDNGCRRMMLEVLTTNHNAFRLYEKHGYRAGHTLKYYSQKDIPLPDGPSLHPVRESSFEALARYRSGLPDCHVNWQNDLPVFAGLENTVSVFEAYAGDTVIGIAAVTAQGRVIFLHVCPEYRNRGLARLLTRHAARQVNAPKLTVSFPGNALLEGFLRKTGFEKDPVEQYEMFLPCDL